MSITDYLNETKGEMKHVSWPTRRQTLYFTLIVVVLSLIIAFFLGFFDYVFAKLLDAFILSQ